MMHLHLLGIALAASFLVRLLSRSHDSLRAQQPMIQQSWQNRWHRAWVVFGCSAFAAADDCFFCGGHGL